MKTLLNFRKIKQDFPSGVLKEGRELHATNAVESAKIVELSAQSIRIVAKVRGAFDNSYESEIEMDRLESELIDSNCDCVYNYDCQHIAALLFYLEEHLDELIVAFSKEADALDQEEEKSVEEAKDIASKRLGQKFQKELLVEYIDASNLLGTSPFFLPDEELEQEKADLVIILNSPKDKEHFEVSLALRVSFRSKPQQILDPKAFLEAVKYQEPIYFGARRALFSYDSFKKESRKLLNLLMHDALFVESEEENIRHFILSKESVGNLLSKAYFLYQEETEKKDQEKPFLVSMPIICLGNVETPLVFAKEPAKLRFEVQYLESPAPKIFLKPEVFIQDVGYDPVQLKLFESTTPGLIHEGAYYHFEKKILRKHLKGLETIRNKAIPEPLFGTFVENALPELERYAEIKDRKFIEQFVTLPFVGSLKARCELSYLEGELEAKLYFLYNDIEVPASHSLLTVSDIAPFSTEEGILSRNLAEEGLILDQLFQGFLFDQKSGAYIAKTDKKIIEFMTDVVPRMQKMIDFECPQNLLDQFIYDETLFELKLKESPEIDRYLLNLKVKGQLEGISLSLLWDCLATKRSFIELERSKRGPGRTKKKNNHKILVLDLEKLLPVVQLLDDLGVQSLDNQQMECPLWSLVTVSKESLKGLNVKLSISRKLSQIQAQMLGHRDVENLPMPVDVNADLRPYQKEGVEWLERLRGMHLNGILADDMGLGKTLQAITSLTQFHEIHPDTTSVVVCPTSLIYNWVEEFHKFNPHLSILAVEGTPVQRKKILNTLSQYDIIITSYTLMQKDIESYAKHEFGYVILDEAQHIKNRSTRNARSVKQLKSRHKLILTGTPVENSLDELWSLFDFLMQGLLSSYDRFIEKYIRNLSYEKGQGLKVLKMKTAPFILRRMKEDVLDDLPPVSELLYRCQLSDVQQALYKEHANSAREELSKLVQKQGFEKVQIHVLATLTRLKQICCHPALFAKEQAEAGDSAKYEMLLELLQTLMEGNHKTVIFSQYTKMLKIMRKDFEKLGIRFYYLDGSSKNRMEIVNAFNQDPKVSVFLVSLKAGGVGLNLVGADTVIHYDMWWNPAVENQATDRVHRIGQTRSVSSYKLITKGTIEEKILELQNRKKELVKQIVATDEEAISKLTWEEVLELLQT